MSGENGRTKQHEHSKNKHLGPSALNSWSCVAEEMNSSGECSQEGGSSGERSSSEGRGSWSSQIEFVLSCVSYAVGLGNIWRFPYLCFENGGGAFLIPYLLMLFCCGLPLFFFELSIGQFSSQGPIAVWSICPLFKGIGYAMFFISFFVGIYYNMILAWAIFFLASSLNVEVPWSSCDNWWNTDACQTDLVNKCNNNSLNSSITCSQTLAGVDSHSIISHAKTPADEFFHRRVLDMSGGIDEPGELRWELVLCLLCAWTIVFFALVKGVKSFGKVVYFTATFPYLILLVLLVRAATLPGYLEGITFYLTPDWHKLTSVKVWADAAVQIFFSLSPCWGGLITLASFNNFHNNHYRDAIVVVMCNSLTSIFSGFVIFGIIGFMAHELNMKVEDVASEGPGLAFIAYPEAVARLPVSPLWAVLFFSMLITLGMGTQFTIMETLVSTITDLKPDLLRRRHILVLLVSCCFMFVCGLPMCTRGGIYVLTVMDKFAGTFSALLVGMAEIVVVAWVYGVDRFLDDIRTMLGYYPQPYKWWRVAWKFFTPLLLVSLVVFSCVDYTPVSYRNYVFPEWANALGWLVSMTSVAMIPLLVVIQLFRTEKNLDIVQRVRLLLKPNINWGPALDEHKLTAQKTSIVSFTDNFGVPHHGLSKQEECSEQEALRNTVI